eukprot:3336077-Heterocapsa_arctica.AAC.1
MRAQVVKDNLAAAEPNSPRYSPEMSQRVIYEMGTSDENLRSDAEAAERRRLREETPVAGGSG